MKTQPSTPRSRAGFTLVELLIVAVLGAVILAATYEVLVTNQRAYLAQQAQIQSQQSVRSGADILFGELREISARGGDLRIMAPDSMEVRALRKFGMACTVNLSGTPRMDIYSAGDWFEDDDSVVVFADVDTTEVEDDTYHFAQINAGDTGESNCGAKESQEISFPGMGPDFRTDTVWAGAPVRSYVWFVYGLYEVDGEWYLGRHGPGEDPVPLIGPLASKTAGGVSFEYLDEDGNTTSTSTDVRQIRITLRTESEVMGPNGELISDSLTTRIYTRN